MKSIILVSCLIAVASAQWNWQQRPREDVVYEHLPNGRVQCRLNCRRPLNECPPVNCPLPDKPALNPQCPTIVCDEQTSHFLFPMPDPNYFYQCRRADAIGNWETLVRECGCMTYFDYEQQRCVHPHEFVRQCVSTPNPIPPPRTCPRECPTCDVPGQTPPVNVPTPETTTVAPPNGCPCAPCVWWPCNPCACNQ